MVSKIFWVTSPVPQLHGIMSVPPFCFINLHTTVSHDKTGLQSGQSRTDITLQATANLIVLVHIIEEFLHNGDKNQWKSHLIGIKSQS